MRPLRPWTLALAAVLACAGAAAAQTKAPEGVKVLRDLEYVPEGHERQKLDLYLPEKGDAPLPLVVWVHGGGWRGGSRGNCPAVFLTARGYAVASVGYRLSQHAVFPAQIEDCKTAIRWLRANAGKYNLDPDHVGAWGGSAGGHLVALLGTAEDVKELEGKGNAGESSRVQCVVDWFGPTDLLAFGPRADDAKSPVTLLLGGAPSAEKEKAALASPVTHVHKGGPPFLIVHGDKDPLVPVAQSEALAEALKKAGVPVTLVTLEGAGHGGKEFRTEENRKRIAEFFDEYLKAKAKPANESKEKE
jgi:acetyl esterase/lipase